MLPAVLTTRCPTCGANAPLSLATPSELSCPFCGHHGPLPAEVAQSLATAEAELRAQDARTHQLSAEQRDLLARSAFRRQRYLLSAALVLVPFLLAFAVALRGTLEDVRYGAAGPGSVVGLLVCLLPAFLSVAGIALGERRVRAALDELRGLVAALPPLGPGQPHRCHVCGGPVAVAGGVAVVRCSFCQADNLVGSEARAATAASRRIAQNDHAWLVRDGATHVAKLATQARRALRGATIGSVIVGWGLGGIASCFLSELLFGGEGPLREAPYVWWEDDRGQCLAEVETDGAGAFRLDLRRGDVALTGANAAGLAPFDLRTLVGQRVVQRRPRFPDRVGTVTRVHGTRGRRNRAVLRSDDGDETTISDLGDLCRLE